MHRVLFSDIKPIVAQSHLSRTTNYYDAMFVRVALERCVSVRRDFEISDFELGLVVCEEISSCDGDPSAGLVLVGLKVDLRPLEAFGTADQGNVTIAFSISPSFIRR